MRPSRNGGVAAGILSYGSAWVVVSALMLAPIALVSVLRETGIVFCCRDWLRDLEGTAQSYSADLNRHGTAVHCRHAFMLTRQNGGSVCKSWFREPSVLKIEATFTRSPRRQRPIFGRDVKPRPLARSQT